MNRLSKILFLALIVLVLAPAAALACHVRDTGNPHADILGPCGDPKYAFQMENTSAAHVVTFYATFVGPKGAPQRRQWNVAPKTERRTMYFHVLPGSLLAVGIVRPHGDQIIDSEYAVNTVNTGVACPADGKTGVVTPITGIDHTGEDH